MSHETSITVSQCDCKVSVIAMTKVQNKFLQLLSFSSTALQL